MIIAMNTYIYRTNKPTINNTEFEVVETKGLGHPDNLCDTLAEKISAAYSQYCLEHYGNILRHMVDKVTVLGGGSKVSFGKGEMTAPIRILLNGRFTGNFGDEIIDYKGIVEQVVKRHFKEVMPLLDVDKWIVIVDNTHTNEGPGVVYDSDGKTQNVRANFFNVNAVGDEKHHANKFYTNDTSTTVNYFPLSDLEQIVTFVENHLNSKDFKVQYPYVGTDIKVMGIRHNKTIELTSCVPFIALYTPTEEFYHEKLVFLHDYIIGVLKEKFPIYQVTLTLNTRDNPQNHDF
jgi:S-adenosylmethionine synthetase